jgi:subtilisin family serine protease
VWLFVACLSLPSHTCCAVAVDVVVVRYTVNAVFFAAAGNEGISVGANSVGSPATNKNGVSVGASLNSHDSWRAMTAGKANKKQYSEIFMAGFSSEGPTADGRLKPDLAAPGDR